MATWYPYGVGPKEDKTLKRQTRIIPARAEFDPERLRGARYSRPCIVEKIDGKWQPVPVPEQRATVLPLKDSPRTSPFADRPVGVRRFAR